MKYLIPNRSANPLRTDRRAGSCNGALWDVDGPGWKTTAAVPGPKSCSQPAVVMAPPRPSVLGCLYSAPVFQLCPRNADQLPSPRKPAHRDPSHTGAGAQSRQSRPSSQVVGRVRPRHLSGGLRRRTRGNQCGQCFVFMAARFKVGQSRAGQGRLKQGFVFLSPSCGPRLFFFFFSV